MTLLSSIVSQPEPWAIEPRAASFGTLAYDRNLVNTSAGAFTATLPAAPLAGDRIEFLDARGTFETYPLTLGRNGKKIHGLTSDYDCNVKDRTYMTTYVDDTCGWSITY